MTTANRSESNSSSPEEVSLIRLFDDTRKRLVETGTRNRLVHVNRSNTRGKVINLVNERSDDVFAILSSGKAMRFLAIGRDKDEPQSTIRLADAGESGFDTDRYTDAQLETRMGPDALQKRLLNIAGEALTAEEESGVNILYIALGFLTWIEDKASSVLREAPLILLPVELVRNQRTSTYDVRLREEDVVTNLPLQQRLKDDFGIHLPELEIEENWNPSSYFEQIDAAIASHNGWKIDRDGMQLGFFSFSKLLMYRDLALEAWPDGAIAKHALTRGLLFEGFESERALMGPEDSLDEILPPEKMFHVVDADASQALVIEEVRLGRNLVVQGPPGTGKSQTITNIIAAAVKEGKRILFLAEKMAALSVVHDRLVKVGLRDVCLELHSRNANKKTVLAELARTLNAAAAVPAMPKPPAPLTAARDKLNCLSMSLHSPIGQSGETPFSVLGLQSKYIGLEITPPSLVADSLIKMSPEEINRLVDVVTRYGEALIEEGTPDLHPFVGTQNLDLQPVDLARLVADLRSASESLSILKTALANSINALGVDLDPIVANSDLVSDMLSRLEGLPADMADIALTIYAVPDLDRLMQALASGAAWRLEQDDANNTFAEAAFESSFSDLRSPLVAGTQSFFARWGGSYRAASRNLAGVLRGPLPKSAQDRVQLVDRLKKIESLKANWKVDETYCAQWLGEIWRSHLTGFARLVPVVAWCQNVKAGSIKCQPKRLIDVATSHDLASTLREALVVAMPNATQSWEEVGHKLAFDSSFKNMIDKANGLEKGIAKLDSMASAIDRYPSWVNLNKLERAIHAAGVPSLVQRIREGSIVARDAVLEIRFARAEQLWRVAREQSPILRDVSEEDRHELAASFADLERARLKDNVTTIVAGHLSQVPQGAMGEMKVIRGEIGKKRGHIALRKLFSSAGTAMQRIKPVMLMSPISVAQYLPPGSLSFDLLVIDEASQVRPEDALGAIARASQIVVVGDQKQLPPSSFFDRLLDDDSAEDSEDGDEGADLLGSAAKVGMMESVLSLCEARGLGSRMLKWHYRSRDPSLIQVSNKEFYDDNLVLPPSPLQNDPGYGLCYTLVDGVYDKGGKRNNRIEGDHIVNRVVQHSREHPDVSLGIVTFSSAQKNLITELLELRRRGDPVLDEFMNEGRAENLFVKNIENVQGDERDVILVSVGYGPIVAGGRLSSMSFGPVNSDGGERRLNVLFTRARVRCEVFASFHPSDIDASRSSRDGTRILKRFLEFANGSALVDDGPSGAAADSPFEEDVSDVIRSLGYIADPQVGSAGFKIDIGVRHPDRPGAYVLAVECDGATYHSALWARERDRLRQDVLEHLGWRFHRIWSTDWFYGRRAEIERLRLALLDAKQVSEAGIRFDGANRDQPIKEKSVSEPAIICVPEVNLKQMPTYKRCIVPMGSGEPHEVPISILADLAIRIVKEEGPIHIDEAARRLASCFGKEKAGSRIVSATRTALTVSQKNDVDLMSDGVFWFMRHHVADTPVRDRSNESGTTAKASSISMLEIRAALQIARVENAGGDDAELVRSAARLLGFKRVGPDLQERIAAGLSNGEQV